MSLTAWPSTPENLGYFRIYAKPPGRRRREITIFRGAPVILNNVSFVDPFTYQTAQLSLPQVTVFDNPGEGDLAWLEADSQIDIVWQNTGSYRYVWTWEGNVVSSNFGISGTESTYTVDLRGAFHGLDDYLAIPSFPKRPIPYEILIAQAFDQRKHPSGLGSFRVLWPSWWKQTVPEWDSPDYMSYLKPWGVTTGQRWTGFTSRSTGSWEPLLTGHVQSLLSVMFASGGAQWSIRSRGKRRAELYLREIPEYEDEAIIEIQLGAPGVDFNGSRDHSQRATVIYGQGVDQTGVSYSGMTISPDGRTTRYEPFAHSPSVWPRRGNPRFDFWEKPKETMIRFQDGVDEISARKIAQGQYQRFAEAGITGSITLTTDVRYADGFLCPRMLIRAGRTIRIKGLFGIKDGVLAHITASNVDFQNLTTTLEFDTKYRDELTVAEVKARTRDALTPLRSLQVGKYANTVQDLVLPWSYAEGSGCIPLGAREFFNEKLPSTATFPYEEWTKKNPPSAKHSREYYIRINPTNVDNSTKNWAGVARAGENVYSIPIRMGQAGSIRLTQLAAYDKHGNVLPVRFHFSVYGNNGVGADSMPKLEDPEGTGLVKYLKPKNIAVNYAAGQAHPFFVNAWEQIKEDGTKPDTVEAQSWAPAPNSQLIVGWGNYYEPAGHSPGRASRGAARTGMLTDDSSWSWDLGASGQLDLQNPENNANEEYSGMLFVMIYCDEQGTEPVYFMGRLYREDPGTQ